MSKVTAIWTGATADWNTAADGDETIVPNDLNPEVKLCASSITSADGIEAGALSVTQAALSFNGTPAEGTTGAFTNGRTLDLGGGSLTIGGAPTSAAGNSDPSAATTLTLGGLSNDSGASFEMHGSASHAAMLAFSSGGAGFAGNSGSAALSDGAPLTLNNALITSGSMTLSELPALTVKGAVSNSDTSSSLARDGTAARTVKSASANVATLGQADRGGSLSIGGMLTDPGSAAFGKSPLSAATTVTPGGLINDSGAGGTAQVPATDSSSDGGLTINATFGAGVPAGLVNAADVAIAFFETTFSANVTMNITFDWAPLGSRTVAESSSTRDPYSYSSVIDALAAVDGSIPADQGLVLPPTDPFPASANNPSDYLWLTSSEAAAIGLSSPDSRPTNTTLDATITLNSNNSYSFYPSLGVGSDQQDAVGTFEHEISEVMGRQCGQNNAAGTGFTAEPLALFRYTSSGQIDTTDNYVDDYFSINGGVTDLQSGMGEPNGDLADWDSSTSDCCGIGVQGIVQGFTPVDVRVMEALGWAPGDTWQNTGSASWSTAGDWSLGVPTSSSDVDVAEGDPQVTAPFEVAALGVAISASITFSSAGVSTVTHDVDINGQVDFDTISGAAGSGLSIGGYLGNGGDITVGVSGGSLSAADQIKAATLDNAGVITLAGHSGAMATLDVVGSAVNDGTINIGQNAKAIFGGSLSGLGGSEKIQLSSGGVLSLEDGTTGEVIADFGRDDRPRSGGRSRRNPHDFGRLDGRRHESRQHPRRSHRRRRRPGGDGRRWLGIGGRRHLHRRHDRERCGARDHRRRQPRFRRIDPRGRRRFRPGRSYARQRHFDCGRLGIRRWD